MKEKRVGFSMSYLKKQTIEMFVGQFYDGNSFVWLIF